MEHFQSVQFSHSVVANSLRPHGLQHTRLPCPSPTPGACSVYVHRVGDAIQHLILCRPLPLLPSIFPSMGVFSNESVLSIRWSKYWSFSISPSNEYSVQLSHLYMTTGKTIALTRWTFVGEVMSLLFNMLSRLEHFQAFYNFSWANNSLWILIWFLLLNQCGSH